MGIWPCSRANDTETESAIGMWPCSCANDNETEPAIGILPCFHANDNETTAVRISANFANCTDDIEKHIWSCTDENEIEKPTMMIWSFKSIILIWHSAESFHSIGFFAQPNTFGFGAKTNQFNHIGSALGMIISITWICCYKWIWIWRSDKLFHIFGLGPQAKSFQSFHRFRFGP